MDDNSESGTLFFVPSNKGESLSSLFLIPMYQFWLHIYIYRIFVLLHIIELLTYHYRSVLLGISNFSLLHSTRGSYGLSNSVSMSSMRKKRKEPLLQWRRFLMPLY